MLPISIYGILDCITLISKYKWESEMKKENPDGFFRMNDPNVLSNLGHVDYLMMS
jgi:hypothetical protein